MRFRATLLPGSKTSLLARAANKSIIKVAGVLMAWNGAGPRYPADLLEDARGLLGRPDVRVEARGVAPEAPRQASPSPAMERFRAALKEEKVRGGGKAAVEKVAGVAKGPEVAPAVRLKAAYGQSKKETEGGIDEPEASTS